MRFSAAVKSDTGRKRQKNQDSAFSLPEIGLFAVADGMGGHQGGETASRIAVETIPESVRSRLSSGATGGEIVAAAIGAANEAIYRQAEQEPQLKGMGTTTTALYFSDSGLTIGHVGDSRSYLVRPEGIWQLTRDHSLVQEKLRAGMITRAQLKTDRMKNVITRSVGFESTVEVDLYEIDTKPGDGFLICSDGLTGMVDEPTIHRILLRDLIEKRDPSKAAASLVDAANAAGGDDNVTAVVILGE